VTWDRDFLFLEYIEPEFVDSRGVRCAVTAVTSVTLNECPEMPKSYQSIRGMLSVVASVLWFSSWFVLTGEILCSGYVTKQLTADTCEIHFVAQVVVCRDVVGPPWFGSWRSCCRWIRKAGCPSGL
jgi:hypothetical protein